MLQNELALYERDHMETSEALEFVETLVGSVLLVELRNLPALVGGRDLALRRRLEAAVYTTRERIADRAAKFAQKWQPS